MVAMRNVLQYIAPIKEDRVTRQVTIRIRNTFMLNRLKALRNPRKSSRNTANSTHAEDFQTGQ